MTTSKWPVASFASSARRGRSTQALRKTHLVHDVKHAFEAQEVDKKLIEAATLGESAEPRGILFRIHELASVITPNSHYNPHDEYP